MPTMTERWEQGIDHDPRSVEIASTLAEIDMNQGSDSLCWKFGGDGFHGEQLLYALDVYFERKDSQYDRGDDL